MRPDFRLLRELPPWLGAEGGGLFCLTDSLPLLEAIKQAARQESGADGKLDLMGFTGGALRVLLPTVGGELGPVYRCLRELDGWAARTTCPWSRAAMSSPPCPRISSARN